MTVHDRTRLIGGLPNSHSGQVSRHNALMDIPADSLRRLLVVEDSQAIAGQVCRLLAAACGLPVDHAQTLRECRDLLEDYPGQHVVAVVDLTLPDADGVDAVDVVSAAGPAVVVLTGSMTEQTYKRIASHAIADFVLKTIPGAAGTVVRAVQRLLRNEQRHVLVVDDSETFRNFCGAILATQRLRVSVAADVSGAQAMLRAHSEIALMVVDHEMPGGDGISFCAETRARHPVGAFGIIGVTGAEDPFVAVRFLKAGADDILRKPFLAEEFASRVNACLDQLDTIARIREQAHRDPLTGLHNRRYLFEFGQRLYANARRENLRLVCAVLDVDHFKRVNDEHGHDVGDRALGAVAEVIMRGVRAGDIAARLGGEEFCVLAANPGDAVELFERIRGAVQQIRVPLDSGAALRLSVSIGATLALGEALDDMIKAADAALYQAKSGGRDRLVIA